jgi:hypothetical protein
MSEASYAQRGSFFRRKKPIDSFRADPRRQFAIRGLKAFAMGGLISLTSGCTLLSDALDIAQFNLSAQLGNTLSSVPSSLLGTFNPLGLINEFLGGNNNNTTTTDPNANNNNGGGF